MNKVIARQGIAALLDDADTFATAQTMDLIKNTPPWEVCNAHQVYHRLLAEKLEPTVVWAKAEYPTSDPTIMYSEGLLTGNEYLRMLISRELIF